MVSGKAGLYCIKSVKKSKQERDMTITKKWDDTGQIIYIRISGKIDSICSKDLLNVVMDGAGQCKNLDIDMSETSYMCSAGIRAIVLGSKACSAKGGRFVIRNASPVVMNTLNEVGLTRSLNFECS